MQLNEEQRKGAREKGKRRIKLEKAKERERA